MKRGAEGGYRHGREKRKKKEKKKKRGRKKEERGKKIGCEGWGMKVDEIDGMECG